MKSTGQLWSEIVRLLNQDDADRDYFCEVCYELISKLESGQAFPAHGTGLTSDGFLNLLYVLKYGATE